jgi:hypothetical protein
MRESRRVEIEQKIEALKGVLDLDQETLMELRSLSPLGQYVMLSLLREMATDADTIH